MRVTNKQLEWLIKNKGTKDGNAALYPQEVLQLVLDLKDERAETRLRRTLCVGPGPS